MLKHRIVDLPIVVVIVIEIEIEIDGTKQPAAIVGSRTGKGPYCLID